MNLEELTIETFAGRVGEEFTIDAVPATLAGAKSLGDRRGPSGRLPFSIELLGPVSDVLPQGTYRLDHGELGGVDVFLVPVAGNAEGVRYEAVFT